MKSWIYVAIYMASSTFVQAGLLGDLIKEWSQFKADVGYGNEFLQTHQKITRSRKEVELKRFNDSLNRLCEHKDEFLRLKYGEARITDDDIAAMIIRLDEIVQSIESLSLRNPGEKTAALPTINANYASSQEYSSDSSSDEHNDDFLDFNDPHVRQLFEQFDNQQEVDP